MYYATSDLTNCEAMEAHTLPSHAILRHGDGSVSWHGLPGDQYLVTGEGPDGEPLPSFPLPTWANARKIPVWRGTYWLQRAGRLIKLIEITPPWHDN